MKTRHSRYDDFNVLRCQSDLNNNFPSDITAKNMNSLTQNDIGIHNNPLKFYGPIVRHFILKYFNKFLSHCLVPNWMIKEGIDRE